MANIIDRMSNRTKFATFCILAFGIETAVASGVRAPVGNRNVIASRGFIGVALVVGGIDVGGITAGIIGTAQVGGAHTVGGTSWIIGTAQVGGAHVVGGTSGIIGTAEIGAGIHDTDDKSRIIGTAFGMVRSEGGIGANKDAID